LRVVKKPQAGEIVNINDVVAPIMTLSERQKTIELDLDPAEGPYYVIVNTWHHGIEAEFYLSAYSPGDFTFESTHSLKPTPQEAAALAAVVFPTACPTCNKPVHITEKKSLKGLTFHADCFRCFSCGSSDMYDSGRENGTWQGYCFDCWNPRFGERCIHCKQTIQRSKAGLDKCSSVHLVGKLHASCREEYKRIELEKKASRCFYCSNLILKRDGYSGEYFDIESKGQIHKECLNNYKKSIAPKCIYCADVVFEIPGKFTGVYFNVEGKGIVHEECVQAYNQSQAQTCLYCRMALISISGKFSGKYLPVGNSGVHEECLLQWRISTSEKCIFCRQPVCEIPGKFSGEFYPIEGQGSLHAECGDAWQKSQ